MKTSIALILTIVTNIFCALAFSNSASAAIHSGSICRSLDKIFTTELEINSEGIKNIGSQPHKVICPLVAAHVGSTTTTTYNGGVLVDYRTRNPLSTSITCTLYSYDFVGNFLGSRTNTSGFNSYISLIGVPVNQWTNHNVVCIIQPQDKIIAIESGL